MKNKKLHNLVFQVIILALVVSVSFILLNKFGREKDSQTAIVSTGKISTIIVPHDNSASGIRAEFFASIKNSISPKTIILVSPNHFDSGTGDIITTDRTWTLSDGKIFPDADKIKRLTNDGLADNSAAAFVGELGIGNVIGDVYRNFPNATIIPIIIRQTTGKDKILLLANELHDICGTDCLLVTSVDCSHYQPGSLASLHDSLTIRALNNLDDDLIWQAEVDSEQSLSLAINWAKLNNSTDFQLEKNTNSGEILGLRDSETVSYILGWYGEGESQKITDEFSFIVGGDMMFDRNVNYRYPGMKLYDAWSDFGQRVFWGTDLSMANLEGPISPTATPAVSSHTMVFNFPPKTTDVLSWLGLNAVSLANNHSSNNGSVGFDNTVKVLTENGITPIGQQNGFDDSGIKTFSNGTSKLTVFAIDILATNADITAQIKQKKAEGSYVLVFPHWGVEYAPKHSSSQANLAHGWIDAGADIVIGGHPHVIQDAEIYKNRPIFYSLGNLLFDQDFSKETQRGLIIAGRFHDNSLELVLLPILSKNYKPALLTGIEKTDLINNFRTYLDMPTCSEAYGCDKIEIKD